MDDFERRRKIGCKVNEILILYQIIRRNQILTAAMAKTSQHIFAYFFHLFNKTY